MEYVDSNLGWQCREERGGDLRVDVWTGSDLGDGSRFGSMFQGALALNVVEWG